MVNPSITYWPGNSIIPAFVEALSRLCFGMVTLTEYKPGLNKIEMTHEHRARKNESDQG